MPLYFFDDGGFRGRECTGPLATGPWRRSFLAVSIICQNFKHQPLKIRKFICFSLFETVVYDPAKDKKEQDDEKANGTKDEEGNAKDWNAEDLLEQHVFYVHRRIPRIVCFVL